MVPGEAITISLGVPRLDRPSVESRWDVLLGVVADLDISIGGQRFLHEEMFPVVELCEALARWLARGAESQWTDFSLTSLESEADPMIEIRKVGGGWQLSSVLQEYPETRVFSHAEVAEAARKFINDVREQVARELNIDVDRWIELPLPD